MIAMDQLMISCEMSFEYPKNMFHHKICDYITDTCYEQLNERQTNLFQGEKDQAFIDFWERDFDAKGPLQMPFMFRKPLILRID